MGSSPIALTKISNKISHGKLARDITLCALMKKKRVGSYRSAHLLSVQSVAVGSITLAAATYSHAARLIVGRETVLAGLAQADRPHPVSALGLHYALDRPWLWPVPQSIGSGGLKRPHRPPWSALRSCPPAHRDCGQAPADAAVGSSTYTTFPFPPVRVALG